MLKSNLSSLHEQRQLIHDLTLLKHATGLSPPQMEMLEQLEAEEASETEPRNE